MKGFACLKDEHALEKGSTVKVVIDTKEHNEAFVNHERAQNPRV